MGKYIKEFGPFVLLFYILGAVAAMKIYPSPVSVRRQHQRIIYREANKTLAEIDFQINQDMIRFQKLRVIIKNSKDEREIRESEIEAKSYFMKNFWKNGIVKYAIRSPVAAGEYSKRLSTLSKLDALEKRVRDSYGKIGIEFILPSQGRTKQ